MAVIVDTDSAGRVRRMYYEEDKMTPRDRSVEIVDEGIVNRTWLVDKIEQAITAAVEEERKACAKILDAEVKRLRDLAIKCREEGGLRGPSMASRVRSSAEICEKMAEQIRARSATSPADTEGEKE